MELGKLGVWSPTDAQSAEQLQKLAQLTESLGYAALWYPEARGHESFALGSYLLACTRTLVLATGIANIYARDAVTTRHGQETLAKVSGGRFLLGLGVSHVPMVEGMRGHTYGKPVTTMGAYLDAMKQAPGLVPQPEPAPPTVLAALGPRMTDLGAARTAGIHPYNIPPEHTAWARERIGAGPWICVEQKVLLVRDASTAREVAREALAVYMGLPNYRNNWLRLGFSESELSSGGSDRFLDAMVAWGDETAIRDRIRQHFDAGADHVCIQPLHPSGGRLPDLEALRVLAPEPS